MAKKKLVPKPVKISRELQSYVDKQYILRNENKCITNVKYDEYYTRKEEKHGYVPNNKVNKDDLQLLIIELSEISNDMNVALLDDFVPTEENLNKMACCSQRILARIKARLYPSN